jgi:lipopolysaccharide/colanic/teichoic acid biosynthesis glycosyltransferase
MENCMPSEVSIAVSDEAYSDATEVRRPFEMNSVAGGRDRATYWACKRVFDIVAAGSLLVILAPLLLFVALLIKITSSGPVIYRQQRVGSKRRRGEGYVTWDIRPFTFYKFRSMYSDTDQSLHRMFIASFCSGEKPQEGSGTGPVFKLKNDPRVTWIGRILRKTSIDELPQLLNVLKGDMSLVGPRPVPTYEVTHYEKRHSGRFAALPGITGLWQVRGRGRVPFEEMIRMDIKYTEDCSLRLDFSLILHTIPAVIRGSGAE